MKKIIGIIVLSILLTIGLEGIILLFTDNLMYDCPEDAEAILTSEMKGKDNRIVIEKEKFHFQPRTVYFKFAYGSEFDSILINLSSRDETTAKAIYNVGRSRSALFEVPENYEIEEIIISGNTTLENCYISENAASIVKKRIPIPLRMLLIFVTSFLVIFYRKNIGDYVMNLRKMIANINWLFVCIGVAWTAVLIAVLYFLTDINRYHIVFAVLSGAAVSAMVMYIKGYIKRIDSLFLIESSLFVILCIWVYPMFVWGGDSYTHFTRTLGVAQVYEDSYGGVNSTYGALIEESKIISYEKVQDKIEVANEEPIYSNVSFRGKIFENTRYIAYITFASGFVIADALNMNAYYAFMLSEIVNAVFCCFLYYLAIRKLKSGKMILILFASFPYILTLTSKYSYTPWVIAWITYGFAYVIGSIQQKEMTVKVRDLIKIQGALLLGMLPKAPYFLLNCITFMIPNRNIEKQVRKKRLLITITTMLILVMTLIFPMIVSREGLAMYTDIRGGENVSAGEQLKFIMNNPATYSVILIKNILSLLSPDSFLFGQCGVTSLGSAMGEGHFVKWPLVIVAIFVFVIITDKKVDSARWLTWKNRLCILIITFINICVLCTVMYMNYSEVGTEIMQGINPLYILTFMFPCFYFLQVGRVKIKKISWRTYNSVVYGGWMVLLWVSIYEQVVNAYY